MVRYLRSRILFVALLGATLAAPIRAQDAVELDGQNLTMDQIVSVAAKNAPVQIAPPAIERMSRSLRVLMLAAEKGIPIYGLNHGVGQNKDKTIFNGPLSAEARRASERFNANNLRATSAGAGPDAPEVTVRAAMLIRLNTMLVGHTGAQVQVAELYRDFLNRRIHPVLPTRASVGEADITILAHVGLAMMGEGEVVYQGQRMPAKTALDGAGLRPLVPFGKDSLAIMSSNAYAAAVAALALHDADMLLQGATRVFALSLEALNGNVSPFLEPVHAIRPYPTQGRTAAEIRALLESSYLWNLSDKRALQDPLSFRTASHVFAVARDALATVKAGLAVQINSSDDNPAVIAGIRPDSRAPAQVEAYFVDDGGVHGAVIPNANFEPLPWVVPLEALSIALSHVSRASAARITRLGSPEFTKLSRFLSPDDETLAFSAIQKAYAALDAEIQSLSAPVSTNPVPLAGDIEDTATNSVDAASRLRRIVEDLYGIVAIELLHAAQGVDLRRRSDPTLRLGESTAQLHAMIRERIPFLDQDRALTPDILAATRFLRATFGAVSP